MKVLISGAGVAGPCLAYWLCRHGFEPTLVERAPRPRAGGYIVDFWGAGFDVAERMGLAREVLDKGYKMRELRLVDGGGRRVGGFPLRVFDRITHGRYTSLPRSELAASLYGALKGRVETIFDDTITAIDDVGRDVRVSFERTPARVFDLVVGADGLHSQVRRLVFGEEARFERFLGMKVAGAKRETTQCRALRKGNDANGGRPRSLSTLRSLVYNLAGSSRASAVPAHVAPGSPPWSRRVSGSTTGHAQRAQRLSS
jgi:2-polyprenyl-6-methoxyphenol hydroxylase-like FAD-dependent oxidoreductase